MELVLAGCFVVLIASLFWGYLVDEHHDNICKKCGANNAYFKTGSTFKNSDDQIVDVFLCKRCRHERWKTRINHLAPHHQKPSVGSYSGVGV